MDQRGLAAKVGIKQPTLSGYERNSIANPKSENVRKLAEFYGVSIEDLMLPEPVEDMRVDCGHGCVADSGAYQPRKMRLLEALSTIGIR